jgi:ATP:ADP antiporter, AAA family
MKQKGFWLRTLNVRPDEWWLVKKLFILQFLQGAGIAFFFTAAYALFLDRVGIQQLPYVFITSAFLLWGAGFLYSKAEHAFSPGKLAIASTIFIATSIVVLRLIFEFEKADWFLYFMLAWFNVLYMLNNLEFWGLAAILFDVRQSKRLFGVISSGDIPAKFIGYTLALLTVEHIGTANLFWAAALCVLASIPFLQSIIRSNNLAEAHHHAKKHPVHRQTSQKVKVMAKNFTGNILIRRLALLTVIISTCFLIINYAFYTGVKEAYKDDVSMAKFIAFFLAITRVAALMIKVIFTSRLINKLGVVNSLLITPVSMILLTGLVLATQRISPGSKIIFYLFGVTAIAIDVLRTAINSPVFLTIMQPLPTHERLRAHTIVKGIMDPFASLITGVLLLAVIEYQHSTDLTSLYYILLALGAVWIAGIYRANAGYLKTIIKTLSSRYFNRDDFKVYDAATLKWLKEKIQTGNETEVTNILRILDNNRNGLNDEMVLAALQHPSEKIKMEGLAIISEKNIVVAETELLTLTATNNGSKIIAQALTMLCKMGIDEKILLQHLEGSDTVIRNAAIFGAIKYGSGESKKLAENLLEQMAALAEKKEQATAAFIAGGINNDQGVQIILSLMKSPDKAVRKAALEAAGKSNNETLLKESLAITGTDEKEVLYALSLAGENALPVIRLAVSNGKTSLLQKEKLIQLAGKINSRQAHHLLTSLLQQQPLLYKPVIKALFRSQYIPEGKQRNIFEEKAAQLLEHSAGIIYMQTRLAGQQEKYEVLINSLNIELTDLRDSLLCIFATLYEREKINQVRTAYLTGKKGAIINAMEIIEMLVRKDLGNRFNVIFEPGDIGNRINELHKLYTGEFFDHVEQILARILEDESYTYHYWTMACSLYTAKKQQHHLDAALIERYSAAENLLLRETAEYAK